VTTVDYSDLANDPIKFRVDARAAIAEKAELLEAELARYPCSPRRAIRATHRSLYWIMQ